MQSWMHAHGRNNTTENSLKKERTIVLLFRPGLPSCVNDSEYDSEYDSDCTQYSVFEETTEVLEMTALELDEESRLCW